MMLMFMPTDTTLILFVEKSLAHLHHWTATTETLTLINGKPFQTQTFDNPYNLPLIYLSFIQYRLSNVTFSMPSIHPNCA